MLIAIVITLLIVATLGYGLRPGTLRSDKLILRRPYNNRYNDASGARDEHVG